MTLTGRFFMGTKIYCLISCWMNEIMCGIPHGLILTLFIFSTPKNNSLGFLFAERDRVLRFVFAEMTFLILYAGHLLRLLSLSWAEQHGVGLTSSPNWILTGTCVGDLSGFIKLIVAFFAQWPPSTDALLEWRFVILWNAFSSGQAKKICVFYSAPLWKQGRQWWRIGGLWLRLVANLMFFVGSCCALSRNVIAVW